MHMIDSSHEFFFQIMQWNKSNHGIKSTRYNIAFKLSCHPKFHMLQAQPFTVTWRLIRTYNLLLTALSVCNHHATVQTVQKVQFQCVSDTHQQHRGPDRLRHALPQLGRRARLTEPAGEPASLRVRRRRHFALKLSLTSSGLMNKSSKNHSKSVFYRRASARDLNPLAVLLQPLTLMFR